MRIRCHGEPLLAFVSRSGVLTRMAENRSKRLAVLIRRSGLVGSSYDISVRSLARALMAAGILVPAGCALAALVWVPLVGLAVIPGAVYLYPELRLRDAASQRKERVEKELPLFSILVNVLGSAGVSLYSILDSVVGTKMFGAIEGEALLVRRDVEIFGMNPNDSLERVASDHPSRKFGDFLNGYTSKVRSGGDLPSYLEGESGALLRELEETWTRYSARVGILGSVMITLFGVVPLLLLVVGAFSIGDAVVGILLYTGVGIPLFTVLLVALAGRMQPMAEMPPRGRAAKSMLVSSPCLAAGLLTGEAWVGTAMTLMAFFVSYGILVRRQLVERWETERALPAFAKDMMEFKRQEYDLGKSILSAAARNRYSRPFDRVLARVAARVQAGVPIDEANVETDSRLTRMVFFLIGQMSRSGGGTVDTMFHLSSYTGKIVEMRRATKAEMRPYTLLSYTSPLLLAFGIAVVGSVLGSVGSSASNGLFSLGLSGSRLGAAGRFIDQASGLLVVVSAAALGLIGAKIVDFTVRNTLRATVNLAVAVVALSVMEVLKVGAIL